MLALIAHSNLRARYDVRNLEIARARAAHKRATLSRARARRLQDRARTAHVLSTARADSELEQLDADRQHGSHGPAPWAKDSSRRQEEEQAPNTAQARDGGTRPHLRSKPRLLLCVRLHATLLASSGMQWTTSQE